jgi:hypothetical protein
LTKKENVGGKKQKINILFLVFSVYFLHCAIFIFYFFVLFLQIHKYEEAWMAAALPSSSGKKL